MRYIRKRVRFLGDEQFIAAWKSGASVREVARRARMSTSGTWNRARKLGLTNNDAPRGKPFDMGRAREARRLRQEGLDYRAVAAQVGCALSAAYNYCNGGVV